jgi:hypothetical protein
LWGGNDGGNRRRRRRRSVCVKISDGNMERNNELVTVYNQVVFTGFKRDSSIFSFLYLFRISSSFLFFFF